MPSTRSSRSKFDQKKESEENSLFFRSSGILLHPTSLPGPYGIGDVGKNASKFLEFLQESGQTLWQFLPLTPHGHAGTPYASPSAMASNPCLISLEPLLEAGLLTEEDTKELTALPQDKVDYDKVTPLKRKILRKARDNFRSGNVKNKQVEAWTSDIKNFVLEEGKVWLDDYALYMSIREKENKCWIDWENDLRDRKKDSIDFARQQFAEAMDEHYFNQFMFREQWNKIREEAKEKGIRLVADIPIFVAYDSADVWANRKIFKLDQAGKQTVQAGVPPDYFSATGQLWGNPMYDWKACEVEKYKWWTLRFRRALEIADIVRIDHFRGFESAWEVSIEDKTAIGGKWVKGPGVKVFKGVEKNLRSTLPIIAEDLGLITPEVHELRDELGFPGMKVLQFAWNNPDSEHLPFQIKTNHTVIYTGTHDNNTTLGWAEQSSNEERKAFREYWGIEPAEKRKKTDGEETKEPVLPEVSWKMIQLALSSVADTAIMQLQDVLELDGKARMNTPATTDGNWSWRCAEGATTSEIASRLKTLTERFGRAQKK